MGIHEMLQMATKGHDAHNLTSNPIIANMNVNKMGKSEANADSNDLFLPAPRKPIILSSSSKMSEEERRQQQERVDRLKAARRAEREKLEKNKKPNKNTTSVRRNTRTSPSKASSSASLKSIRNNVSHNTSVEMGDAVKSNQAVTKKLNFKDLMSQAEQIDAENLKLKMKVKDKKSLKREQSTQSSNAVELDLNGKKINGSPSRGNNNTAVSVSRNRSMIGNDFQRQKFLHSDTDRFDISSTSSSKDSKTTHKKRSNTSPNPLSSTLSNDSRTAHTKQSNMSAFSKDSKTPHKSSNSFQPTVPLSKPMAHIVERNSRIIAERRGQRNDYYDSDLDDFIEDDKEEDTLNEDYDRDEIWRMFNRGRSRSYYEDRCDEEEEDSDMEASSAQVLQEETRSAFHGRREDDEEERRLKTLADKKKKRRLN